MDADDTLLLNISTGPGVSKFQQKRSKEKRHNNKKIRLKDRRDEKFKDTKKIHARGKQEYQNQVHGKPTQPANNVSTTQQDVTAMDSDSESTPLVKRIRTSDSADTSKSKQEAKPNVISSLFNKNPDIPDVKQAEVATTEENLFSKTKFSQLPLHPHLVSCLDKMSMSDMTEVQQRTIPHVLKGSDVLVKSQTGSGKTLSYAVPLIQSLRSKTKKICRSDGVYAVILVPTRELALQSLAVIKKLVQSCIWIVPGLVIGGESRKSEKACLRKGVNILVATPGRLVDHCTSTNSLTFDNLQYLIIDEADRLLDMGFEKDVSKILTSIKEKKRDYNHENPNMQPLGTGTAPGEELLYQSVLLSATLSSDVKRLASIALINPVTVDVSVNTGDATNKENLSKEGEYSLPSSLNQHYVITPSKLRLVTLTAFILDKLKYSAKKHKMIVFLPAQEVVQFYYDLLQGTINTTTSDNSSDVSDSEDEPEQIFDVFALHGDMEQKYRSEVYTRFAAAESGVLLCTDVAARGLDLKSVDWILQLSPPSSVEDYVHRVGRAARIGITGNALLFLLPSEVRYLETLSTAKISLKAMDIDEVLRTCITEAVSLDSDQPTGVRSGRQKKGNKRTSLTIQEAATAVQDSLEEWTYNEPARLAQAKSAYQSFVRSYATFPTKMKDIFHVRYLHLGHLAKSFCLREAPGAMSGTATSSKLDRRTKAIKKAARPANNRKRKHDRMSEFASG